MRENALIVWRPLNIADYETTSPCLNHTTGLRTDTDLVLKGRVWPHDLNILRPGELRKALLVTASRLCSRVQGLPVLPLMQSSEAKTTSL